MALEKSKDDLRQEFTRTQNKKKNTKLYCKGKEGEFHIPEIVVNHNLTRTPCGWRALYWSFARRHEGPKDYRYSCQHAMQCVRCNKYTEYLLNDLTQCPNYTPKPAIG